MPNSMKKAYIGSKNEYVDKNGRLRRVRKQVPKFDALFLSKPDDPFEDSMDNFQLPKNKKRRNVTEESMSSGNETFDLLCKDAKIIRKAPSSECSNAKSSSSECDLSTSSVHFLSPLAVLRGQNKVTSKSKYDSPDMFSDSLHTGKLSVPSATKNTAVTSRKDNVVIQLSPVRIPQNHNSLKLPYTDNPTVHESNCIVTSTPNVARNAAKSYLTRLNHISPMEKEFSHNQDIIQPPLGMGRLCVDGQNEVSEDSSIYHSVKGGLTTSCSAQYEFSVPMVLKQPPVKRHTSQGMSLIARSKTMRSSAVCRVYDNKSILDTARQMNSSILNNSYQICNISISLSLSHAKDWRRTLRKTVQQLPEDCLLMKNETGATGKVENMHSRSLLEALTISLDESKKEEEVKEDTEEIIFLSLCNQTAPLPLKKFFPKSILRSGKKIGEGIYGEVFALKTNQKKAVVVKLIPIEGEFKINEEPQKTFKEITSELFVCQIVSKLFENVENNCENFPYLSCSKCLQGKYTPELIKLWDKFNKEKDSQNDRPTVFPKDQLYLLLEFDNAGEDLETFELSNASQGYSIFLQIAYALGVAEEDFEFEHRDLHWGNVLIKATEQKYLNYRVKEKKYHVESRGLKATIIDFTLSRCQANKCVYFNDLSKDPTLFIAEGDFQFEIYREMRKLNKNQWSDFNPKTNIFWLHYLLTKLIKECKYKKKASKIHKKFINMLKKREKEILSYDSALHFMMDVENI